MLSPVRWDSRLSPLPKTRVDLADPVAYEQGNTAPALQETIETGPGVAARYRAFTHTRASCKAISFSSDGQNYSGTVGAMSFPKLGNESSAYSIVLTDQGIT